MKNGTGPLTPPGTPAPPGYTVLAIYAGAWHYALERALNRKVARAIIQA
jgi:hypothetical protein